MINPRLLIQLPLILLGSCVPIQPQPNTSITIYTNNDGKLVERKLSDTGDEICRTIDPTLIEHYVLPRLPDLASVPDARTPAEEKAQARAIIKEQAAHIKVLRTEILRVVKAAQCGQKIPEKP